MRGSARDLVIVGAGVNGCSIARAMARAGWSLTVVDGAPEPGYGSTSHSSAIVRPFYSHRTACAVAHEARFRWLAWADFLGAPDPRGLARYTEAGGLILLRDSEPDAFAGSLAALRAVGVPFEVVDADAVVRLCPGIDLTGYGPPRRRDDPLFGEPSGGRIVGGIHLPAAGYVNDPQLAAHNLMTSARSAGAEFRFGAAVVEVLRSDGGIDGVALADGSRISCPRGVNAAGPHSARLNALAGCDPPIGTRAVRHEVAYLGAPASYAESGPGFLADPDLGLYGRPDGADLVTGTIDPPCDPVEVVDPDAWNEGFTEQWTLQAWRAGLRFPELGIPGRARGTVSLYDVSDDWIPLYDRSEVPGWFLAVGTSGNQFKNAPVVGDLMRAVLEADAEGRDVDTEPPTVHLPHVATSVSMAFYSRLRTVQGTRSVLA